MLQVWRKKIKKVYIQVEATFRSCALCERNFASVDLFCSRCWKRVDSQFATDMRLYHPEYDFPVYALATWTLDNEPLLAPLIYGLKCGGNEAAVHRLCMAFSLARQSLPPPISQPVFVPAPARRAGQRDHAYILARTFSEIWRGSLVNGLIRVSTREQKTLEKAERKRIRLEALPNQMGGHIVFVDDLVTTGSTAQAAYLALGKPKSFQVWALVVRDKLAPFQAF